MNFGMVGNYEIEKVRQRAISRQYSNAISSLTKPLRRSRSRLGFSTNLKSWLDPRHCNSFHDQ